MHEREERKRELSRSVHPGKGAASFRGIPRDLARIRTFSRKIALNLNVVNDKMLNCVKSKEKREIDYYEDEA